MKACSVLKPNGPTTSYHLSCCPPPFLDSAPQIDALLHCLTQGCFIFHMDHCHAGDVSADLLPPCNLSRPVCLFCRAPMCGISQNTQQISWQSSGECGCHVVHFKFGLSRWQIVDRWWESHRLVVIWQQCETAVFLDFYWGWWITSSPIHFVNCFDSDNGAF